MPEGLPQHDIAAGPLRTAVPIAADDQGSLLETVAVLNDPQAMADIDAYRAAPEDVVPWSVVEAELHRAGRLPSRPSVDLDHTTTSPRDT